MSTLSVRKELLQSFVTFFRFTKSKTFSLLSIRTASNPPKAYYTILYNVCVVNCATGDLLCVSVCSRTYQENILQCPCQSGCPNGCPCEVYVCPTTTTSTTTTTALPTTTTTTVASPKTEVLVLSTMNKENVPIITNVSGREDRNFYFMMDENTQVRYSCGLTWRNQHFIFGGDSQKKQISKIKNCKLELVGQLDFNHYDGGCANVGDNRIYLCFNDDSADYQKCRMSTSPTSRFEEITTSINEHKQSRIAASERKTNYHICF